MKIVVVVYIFKITLLNNQKIAEMTEEGEFLFLFFLHFFFFPPIYLRVSF